MWLSGREDVDIRCCSMRVVEWVDLLRGRGGCEACFWGWVSDYVYIGERIVLLVREERKSKILAVYIEI